MRGGYSRTEAGRVPVRRMYRVLRSLRMMDIDRIREGILVARAGAADSAGIAMIERMLMRQETALGRRLLSASDRVGKTDLGKLNKAQHEARKLYERNTRKRRNNGHTPQPGHSGRTD